MPQPIDESSVPLWVFAVFAASIGTWLYLVTLWLRRGTVLPYESRRPVPWAAWATLLAVLNVFVSVIISSRVEPERPIDSSAALNLALSVATQLLFVSVFFFVVAIVSKATRSDLGLPNSPRQLLYDVAIGVLACFAAYLPIAIVFELAVRLFGKPDLHPMIKQVKQHGDTLVLAIAFFSAVVVAPIVEEIIFRLLLQGWLEKWEDQLLGWRNTTEISDQLDLAWEGHNVAVATATPPEAGLGKMPYGSLPILISSTLFAWAHIGHSIDPFPLFVLALFFGIIYQRTHRIVPCIVAHAIFNLVSMILFWQTQFK